MVVIVTGSKSSCVQLQSRIIVFQLGTILLVFITSKIKNNLFFFLNNYEATALRLVKDYKNKYCMALQIHLNIS